MTFLQTARCKECGDVVLHWTLGWGHLSFARGLKPHDIVPYSDWFWGDAR